MKVLGIEIDVGGLTELGDKSTWHSHFCGEVPEASDLSRVIAKQYNLGPRTEMKVRRELIQIGKRGRKEVLEGRRRLEL